MTIPQPHSQKASAHKKKKKKSTKRVTPSEDISTPPDTSRPQHSLSSSLPSIPQTQAELLATANDLYRQIETAAASALSSGAHGGAGDDEYWNNLPAHLRSFIRSALPIGPNGNQVTLTPEQMAEAAGRLAGAVQSGNWVNCSSNLSASQEQWGLPLSGHPDFPSQSQRTDSALSFGADNVDDFASMINDSASKKSKKKKKKKGNVSTESNAPSSETIANNVAAAANVPPKRPSSTLPKPSTQTSTSGFTTDSRPGPSSERENIRDFWLGLSESERRSLVKVEKETVLRKMKEQQRHGCSCAVCGRKRSAIEDELEVLYDAYYLELEQYALHQRRTLSSGGATTSLSGSGLFPGSVDPSTLPQPNPIAERPKVSVPPRRRDHKNPKLPSAPRRTTSQSHSSDNHQNNHAHHHHHRHPEESCTHSSHGYHTSANRNNNGNVFRDGGRGKQAQQSHDTYEDEDEGYEFDEVEDEFDDDEGECTCPCHHGYEDDEVSGDDLPPLEDTHHRTVPKPPTKLTKSNDRGKEDFFDFGNTLTVKEGGILTVADDLLKNDGQKFLEMMESLAEKRIQREREASDNMLLEDEEDEEEEYEDYTEDEDDDELDEEDLLTEEQRMEEGRKMFQIFAARMFEQRVLAAYREKVAAEKQLQLLKELEEEDKAVAEKEAKKAKDAQKKKDKKKAQKQQKEEEKSRLAADRLAEEEAAKAAAEAKEQAERAKAEAARLKREEERKAREAELARHAEEKRKREEAKKAKQDEEARKKREAAEKAKADREARQREAQIKAEAEKKQREKEKRERQERLEKEKEKEREKEKEKEKEKEDQRLKKEREKAAEVTKTATTSSIETSQIPLAPSSHKNLSSRPNVPSKIAVPPATSSNGNEQLHLDTQTSAVTPSRPSPISAIRPSSGDPRSRYIQQSTTGPAPIATRPPSAPRHPVAMTGSAVVPQSPHQPQGPPRPSSASSQIMYNSHNPHMPIPNTAQRQGNIQHIAPPFMQQHGSLQRPAHPNHSQPSSVVPRGAYSPHIQMPVGQNQQQISSSQPPNSTSMSPVSPARPTSSTIQSPTVGSATSQLAALNFGSQPIDHRKPYGTTAAPGTIPIQAESRRVSGDIGAIRRPINSSENIYPGASGVNLRSPTPPPALGSSALLEELDEAIEPPTETTSMPTQSVAGASGFGGLSSFGGAFAAKEPASSTWTMQESNLWANPSSAWPKQSPVTGIQMGNSGPQPAASKPDRATIISDRAIIAYKKMASAMTSSNNFFMAGDLHEVSVRIFPDGASVSLREFVESCHQSGQWEFHQDQGRLSMRHVGLHASPSSLSSVPPVLQGQPAQPNSTNPSSQQAAQSVRTY